MFLINTKHLDLCSKKIYDDVKKYIQELLLLLIFGIYSKFITS